MRIEDLSAVLFPSFSLSFSWVSKLLPDTLLSDRDVEYFCIISMGLQFWKVIRNVHCLLNSNIYFLWFT